MQHFRRMNLSRAATGTGSRQTRQHSSKTLLSPLFTRVGFQAQHGASSLSWAMFCRFRSPGWHKFRHFHALSRAKLQKIASWKEGGAFSSTSGNEKPMSSHHCSLFQLPFALISLQPLETSTWNIWPLWNLYSSLINPSTVLHQLDPNAANTFPFPAVALGDVWGKGKLMVFWKTHCQAVDSGQC